MLKAAQQFQTVHANPTSGGEGGYQKSLIIKISVQGLLINNR